MHQFEIGVWKAVYTHMLRILVAESATTGRPLINILNLRFVDTYHNSRSSMTKLMLSNWKGFDKFLSLEMRSFENLGRALPLCRNLPLINSRTYFNVQCLLSRVSYRPLTTKWSWTYYSRLRHGMASRSCAYIQLTRLYSLALRTIQREPYTTECN